MDSRETPRVFGGMGRMEIKERINTCLSALEQKQQSVDTFQAKVRVLIDSLKAEGMTPGTLASLLSMLESVLKDYAEISQNCQQMVVGLRELFLALPAASDPSMCVVIAHSCITTPMQVAQDLIFVDFYRFGFTGDFGYIPCLFRSLLNFIMVYA